MLSSRWRVWVWLLVATLAHCGPRPVVVPDGGGGSAAGGSAGGGTFGGGGGSAHVDAGRDAGCAVVACYTFSLGMPGVGRCRSGLQCAGDADAGCGSQVGPIAEACNGVDDDCNGIVDDGCGCAYVAPSGDDSNPATASLPVRRISVGIAAASDAGLSRVCVAAGAACPQVTAYGGEALIMRNGISVFGQYESTGWSRDAGCVTQFLSRSDAGVLFDEAVSSPTVLDGFAINAFPSSEPRQVAVTVRGSRGAVLSNDYVSGHGVPGTSIGIEITGGATPTVRDCRVQAGLARDTSIGISSRSSAPVIIHNCGAFGDAGECVERGPAGNGIVATYNMNTAEQIGVLLDDSSGAVVDSSAISGTDIGLAQSAIAVKVRGNAAGLEIRRNSLHGGAGTMARSSAALDVADCLGTSLTIEDNFEILGADALGFGSAAPVAIRAAGDCRLRISRNVQVIGCSPTSASAFCSGIECLGSACEIDDNLLLSAGRGGVALKLDRAVATVRRNRIEGCASPQVGISSVESTARFENNVVRTCSPPGSASVRIVNGPPGAEVDFHSNTVVTAGCTALQFDVSDGGLAAGPAGVVRNNILIVESCSPARIVDELVSAADPRLFEHNALYSPVSAAVLYRDEGGVDVTDAGALGSGNLFVDPALTSTFHLTSGSICRNSGTDAGAPPVDIDGDARPAEGRFDIGADEY